MKLSCNVTQDLLPLYHDGVCSEESRTLVAQHLEECEACKKIMEDLNAAPAPEVHVDDAAALKALKKQWGKSLAKSFAKGIAIAVLAFGVLYGAWFGLTQWIWVPVPADHLNVSNVAQLSTGQLVYTMDATDGKSIRAIYTTYDFSEGEAALYIVPKRPILPGKASSLEQRHNNYLLTLEEMQVEDYRGGAVDISAVYVGPVGKGTLIWEKGMELPPASQAQEDYWADEWSSHFNAYLGW